MVNKQYLHQKKQARHSTDAELEADALIAKTEKTIKGNLKFKIRKHSFA